MSQSRFWPAGVSTPYKQFDCTNYDVQPMSEERYLVERPIYVAYPPSTHTNWYPTGEPTMNQVETEASALRLMEDNSPPAGHQIAVSQFDPFTTPHDERLIRLNEDFTGHATDFLHAYYRPESPIDPCPPPLPSVSLPVPQAHSPSDLRHRNRSPSPSPLRVCSKVHMQVHNDGSVELVSPPNPEAVDRPPTEISDTTCETNSEPECPRPVSPMAEHNTSGPPPFVTTRGESRPAAVLEEESINRRVRFDEFSRQTPTPPEQTDEQVPLTHTLHPPTGSVFRPTRPMVMRHPVTRQYFSPRPNYRVPLTHPYPAIPEYYHPAGRGTFGHSAQTPYSGRYPYLAPWGRLRHSTPYNRYVPGFSTIESAPSAEMAGLRIDPTLLTRDANLSARANLEPTLLTHDPYKNVATSNPVLPMLTSNVNTASYIQPALLTRNPIQTAAPPVNLLPADTLNMNTTQLTTAALPPCESNINPSINFDPTLQVRGLNSQPTAYIDPALLTRNPIQSVTPSVSLLPAHAQNLDSTQPISTVLPVCSRNSNVMLPAPMMLPTSNTSAMLPLNAPSIVNSSNLNATLPTARAPTHESPEGRNDPTYICCPPKFRGEDWETFIIEFTNCARANRWGEESKLNYLLSCLQGDAAYSCKLEYETYADLVGILAQNYADEVSQEQIVSELQTMRQDPEQSIRGFKMAIMKCYWRLNAEHRRECSPKLCFMNGLYDIAVRTYVKQNRPTDINQAVELAIRQDTINKENDRILAQRPRLRETEPSPHASETRERPTDSVARHDDWRDKYIEKLQNGIDSAQALASNLLYERNAANRTRHQEFAPYFQENAPNPPRAVSESAYSQQTMAAANVETEAALPPRPQRENNASQDVRRQNSNRR